MGRAIGDFGRAVAEGAGRITLRATSRQPCRSSVFGTDAAVDFPQRRSHITSMKYRVVIEPDEDGVFVAECAALPGCISQGKTRAEALANIKDAMTGYLASLKKHGDPVPPPII